MERSHSEEQRQRGDDDCSDTYIMYTNDPEYMCDRRNSARCSWDTLRMEPTRAFGRPSHMRRCMLAVLALSVIALAGCESSQQSPEVPVRYQDPEVGAARLMADETTRVRDVVNVTSDYPDPDNQVVG